MVSDHARGTYKETKSFGLFLPGIAWNYMDVASLMLISNFDYFSLLESKVTKNSNPCIITWTCYSSTAE